VFQSVIATRALPLSALPATLAANNIPVGRGS
jgi:hypothetical protein